MIKKTYSSNLNLNESSLLSLIIIFLYSCSYFLFNDHILIILIFALNLFSFFCRLFLIKGYQLHFLLLNCWILIDFIFPVLYQTFKPLNFSPILFEPDFYLIFYLFLIVCVHEIIIFLSELLSSTFSNVPQLPFAGSARIKKTVFFFTLIPLFAIFWEHITVNWNLDISSNIGSYYLVPLISFLYGVISLLIFYILFESKYSSTKKVMFILLLLLIPTVLMFIRPSKAQFFRPVFFTFVWISLIFYQSRFKIFLYSLLPVSLLYISSYLIVHNFLRNTSCFINNLSFVENTIVNFRCIFSRFYGMDAFIASKNYIYDKGLLYGETFYELIFFWIPRKIWTDKPITITYEFGFMLQPYFSKNTLTGFTSSSLIGEFLLNFGYVGILIYILFMTSLLFLANKFISISSRYLLFIFPIFLFHIMLIMHGGLAPHIAMFLADFLPYSILFYLCYKKIKP